VTESRKRDPGPGNKAGGGKVSTKRQRQSNKGWGTANHTIGPKTPTKEVGYLWRNREHSTKRTRRGTQGKGLSKGGGKGIKEGTNLVKRLTITIPSSPQKRGDRATVEPKGGLPGIWNSNGGGGKKGERQPARLKNSVEGGRAGVKEESLKSRKGRVNEKKRCGPKKGSRPIGGGGSLGYFCEKEGSKSAGGCGTPGGRWQFSLKK